jgi:hypothetical protein
MMRLIELGQISSIKQTKIALGIVVCKYEKKKGYYEGIYGDWPIEID